MDPPAPPEGPAEPLRGPGEDAIPERSVGDLLGEAFRTYRRSWGPLVAVVAVVAVPLSFLQTYLTTEVFPGTIRVVNDRIVTEDLWRFFAGLAVIVVAGVLLGVVSAGAIMRSVAWSIAGRPATVGQAYRYGVRRFGSILLVGLLTVLAVLGGFILLVIPGFVVLVRLLVATPALVVEDLRGRRALSRSWSLVRGRSWPVFGVFLLAGIIAGVVSSALTVPVRESSWVVQGTAQSVAAVLTQPFVALTYVLIYVDLRVRREGLTVSRLEAELRESEPAA